MFSPASVARAGTLLIVALIPGLSAGAESLGRLFHSPAERARIDRPPPPPAKAPAAAPPRLDGIITRSDGRPVIFLDGQATPVDARQVRMNDASARVTTPDGQRYRLHVGDSPLNTGAP